MAATSEAGVDSKDTIAAELMRLFKRVDYSTVIRPLKLCDMIPIKKFGQLSLSLWFELDTSKCFVGKRKLKFNDQCIYDIYGAICGKTREELRDLVRAEVSDNPHWYNRVTRLFLDWNSIDLDSWLKRQKLKKFKPDELCLYTLNIIHRRHAIVYTEFQPWCTVDRKTRNETGNHGGSLQNQTGLSRR